MKQLFALALLLACMSAALAAPDGVIRNSVAVCDPNSPTHCVAPDSSGNIPTAPPGVTDSVSTATLTNVSGNCLGVSTTRRMLTLDATNATANIGYCEGVACTAAIGTAGTTVIPYGTWAFWPAGSAPKNAMCFVAASGSQAFTIREGQ